jgi:hypothetical protein
LIDLCGCDAQVASSNHVQRLANVFRRGLGGESLSATRGTEEVDDQALTLSLDEIVEAKVLVMGLHEGLEQLFPSRGKDKVRERLIVPLDIGNLLNVELD